MATLTEQQRETVIYAIIHMEGTDGSSGLYSPTKAGWGGRKVSKKKNIPKSQLLKALAVILVTLIMPSICFADCTKLVDKHLEYYQGLKYAINWRADLDLGIKTIPYDIKIIYNHSQQYPLYTADVSFVYPNDNARPVSLGFQDAYLQAICIVQTPDGSKWVVWQHDTRLYFFDEGEQPQQ